MRGRWHRRGLVSLSGGLRASTGQAGSVLAVGRSPGEGKGWRPGVCGALVGFGVPFVWGDTWWGPWEVRAWGVGEDSNGGVRGKKSPEGGKCFWPCVKGNPPTWVAYSFNKHTLSYVLCGAREAEGQ